MATGNLKKKTLSQQKEKKNIEKITNAKDTESFSMFHQRKH